MEAGLSRKQGAMVSTPLPTKFEEKTQTTFRSLMLALSYPGRLYSLPGGSAAVAETLVDLETSYFVASDDSRLHDALRLTGAKEKNADEASYHFYDDVDMNTHELLQAPLGTLLEPDKAATLVIRTNFSNGKVVRLSGPGIQNFTRIQIDVPEDFWNTRAEAVRYPLGWDVFFLDGERVMGLPRTTRLEVM
jgi:alpha-D-ribose 1-methylphosphonate 5-triphosphate synthase subunit PhnH